MSMQKRSWRVATMGLAATGILFLAAIAWGSPIADPDFTVPILNPADLQRFVTPMPNAYQLEVSPDTTTYPGEDYYRIDMGQFNHDMALLLNPAATGYATPGGQKLPLTPAWGYGLVPPGSPPNTPGAYTFPGPTIVNTQGRPTRVTWTNSLPLKHVVGIDPTLHCGMNAPNCAPENRVVPHAHGSHVWDDSDGSPLSWFSNGFTVTGETWRPNSIHGPMGTYRYINDQEAGTIWYHDHAMGLTHLNVYAGLAGFFLVTDANEANLRNRNILPQKAYEVPIALQDRKFYPDGKLALPNNPVLDETATIGAGVACDSTPGATAPYACTGSNAILAPTITCDPAAILPRFACPPLKFSKSSQGNLIPYDASISDPLLRGPFEAPSITPEFFGNVFLANGKAWPEFDVEPRIYRFRLLNGSDSRTFFLRFEDPQLKVWQIGTEQAFFDNPVDRTNQFMILMPGERIDILVDFKTKSINSNRVVLENYGSDGPWDGTPQNPLWNRDIPQLIAFDVTRPFNSAVPDPVTPPAANPTLTLNTALRGTVANTAPPFVSLPTLSPTAGAPVRKLSLVERMGTHGRLQLTLDGREFMDMNSAVSETPRLGDTEIWEIANLTPDAHPIHLHLVAFQLINRQNINFIEQIPTPPFLPYTAPPPYTLVPGTITPPDPWEEGWKDTLQMVPGTVTRIIAKFDIPGLYVWHCHILSHEENDMMRPLIVTTPAKSVGMALSRNGTALNIVSEPASLATPITMTAEAVTGLGAGLPQNTLGYEYQFSVINPAGSKTVLVPFTTWMSPMANSATWTPPTTAPGIYTLMVEARSAGTSATEASSQVSYQLLDTPNGDLNGDGKIDMVDALRALQISAGIYTATAEERGRADVAPMLNGKPAPDGVIDIGDALVILKKGLGLI